MINIYVCLFTFANFLLSSHSFYIGDFTSYTYIYIRKYNLFSYLHTHSVYIVIYIYIHDSKLIVKFNNIRLHGKQVFRVCTCNDVAV